MRVVVRGLAVWVVLACGGLARALDPIAMAEANHFGLDLVLGGQLADFGDADFGVSPILSERVGFARRYGVLLQLPTSFASLARGPNFELGNPALWLEGVLERSAPDDERHQRLMLWRFGCTLPLTEITLRGRRDGDAEANFALATETRAGLDSWLFTPQTAAILGEYQLELRAAHLYVGARADVAVLVPTRSASVISTTLLVLQGVARVGYVAGGSTYYVGLSGVGRLLGDDDRGLLAAQLGARLDVGRPALSATFSVGVAGDAVGEGAGRVFGLGLGFEVPL